MKRISKVKTRLIKLQLLLVFMAVLVSGCGQKEVNNGYSIRYHYENQEAGNAYGTIEVQAKSAGSYELYWGDERGERLSFRGVPFGPLADCEIETDGDIDVVQIISPYTAIPEQAATLLLTDESGMTVSSYDIPKKKLFSGGELKFAFGAMSDVHFNRYADYSEDDAVDAFHAAMSFMNEAGVDFVGVAGDLSQVGELRSYEKFNNEKANYPNITVYSCMGNHDDVIDNGKYKEEPIANFREHVNLGLFEDPAVLEIADTGVDFVYEKEGDIFVFFSQLVHDYGDNERIVLDEQLEWLENVLETYQDRNIFLFFHTFFTAEDGNGSNGTGNLMNPAGYSYGLTFHYGNEDEAFMRSLFNKFGNVTVFSGHSHWAFEGQKYNPFLNIGNINSKNTGATLVHIPSVTAPCTIEEDATERKANNGERSEGYLVLRYEDEVVYMGVDFLKGELLSYAIYRDPIDVLQK